MSQEVVGLDALRGLADSLFGDRDPIQVFHHGPIQEITREGGRHVLTLKLPFTSRKDLSVVETGEELVV